MDSDGPSSRVRLTVDANEQLDRVCDCFEQAWRDGSALDFRHYLSSVSEELQPRLLTELIALEVDLRQAAGERVAIDEYLRRFPDQQDIVRNGFGKVPSQDEAQSQFSTLSRTQDGDTDRESDSLPQSDDSSVFPSQIDRFEIRSHLGSGQFGDVFLAHDPLIDRLVALKRPRAERIGGPAGVERYLQEARNAGKLRHSGIVGVYDVRKLDDSLIVVQQYIPGQTLAEKLKSERFAPATAANIVLAIAEALGHAHQEGLVHRDLKPANILLDEQGQPYVADFGLSLHETVQRRHKGERAGSPAYMSPEQVRGESHRLDGRSDIWSLGVVFYEMLCGQLPFGGDDLLELFDEIEHRDPRSPRMLNPEVPTALENVCLKCLAKRHTERYASAIELIEAIEDAIPALARRRPYPAPLADDVIEDSGGEQEDHIDDGHGREVFVSYAHGNADEEELARLLYERLNARRHRTFLDKAMTAGIEWAQEIRRRVHRCDCMVVLLSKSSMRSEMVHAEVRLAQQRRSQTGLPRLIPVRVGYAGPLEYELELYLGHVQQLEAHSPNDFETVVQQVLMAVSEPAEPRHELRDSLDSIEIQVFESASDTATPHAMSDVRAAAIPGGTIRPNDFYYVRRSQDDVVEMLARESGHTLVVKGARQMGKSSLLLRYLSECQKAGKQIGFVDFSVFSDAELSDYEAFLHNFALVLTHRLQAESTPEVPIHSQFAMFQFLERQVLESVSGPVVIALDEVDRLYGRPYQTDFFSMLRLWHNSRSPLSPNWESLDLAMAISTEPYLLVREADRSPFNVGLLVEMAPFERDAFDELNGKYSGVLTTQQAEELWNLLRGHPYLTRMAYYRLTAPDKITFNELVARAADDRGPFGDHLRALLVKLHEDIDLMKGMQQVIATGTLPDRDLYYRLYGAGLVREDNGRVNPSNLLYARYFRKAI